METNERQHPSHLAWHETLEMHELVAFQATGLMKLKHSIHEVNDPKLQNLYKKAIKGLEQNLTDLLRFYPEAPSPRFEDEEDRNLSISFFSSDLLALTKTSVRNYAIAITETATPLLRDTFDKHLQRTIKMHGEVFAYMYEKGLYPAYNLEKLLQGDVKKANSALNMKY